MPADVKISLNIMPWFKDGFQERIAAAMLSGTVSVTDESIYIRENFTDGKEQVLYSLKNLEELPVKVKWLLEPPERGKPGEIIQIKYGKFHDRQMLKDSIQNINGIMDMIAHVKLYDKIEKCDIEYFYMQFLSQYVKISANYPEINISQPVFDYLMGISEEQVEFAAELLNLECLHILSFLLAVENGELAKELAREKDFVDLIKEEMDFAGQKHTEYHRKC